MLLSGNQKAQSNLPMPPIFIMCDCLTTTAFINWGYFYGSINMPFKSPNRTFLKKYGWKQIEGKNHWYHPQYPNRFFFIQEAITLQRVAIGKKPLPWVDDEKEHDLFDNSDN